MLKHCYGSVNSLPLAKNDQPLPPSRVRWRGGGDPHGTAPFGSQHAHLPAMITWPPSPITYQGATGALRTQ